MSHHSRDKKKNKHMIEKLIVLVQLLLSAVFIMVAWDSGLLPVKYVAAVSVLLLVLFGICFGMQYIKNKVHIVGVVLSVLVSIALVFGNIYLSKANNLLKDVGGAAYKTDNMVVVVKKNNPAKNLLDAKNYRFGIQTTVDQENNELMKEDVGKVIGREMKLIEYETIQEEAQALLDGKVEAAIYNEAFTGIIEESIEDYSSEVRILYQYGIDTPIEVEEKADVLQPFNIYISGIDVAGPITTNSRSDVNIIMSVNPTSKQILLTTTPRDYYVQIPNISGEQKDKLTHAGIYGVDVSMNTLESIYGIDITYYARVNFTSLITIVDALGGVNVESEYAFSAGGYDFVQGTNHLNGAQALAFSRERYSFAEGDNQRGKNQEAVLTAILQKAMSPAILTNASQIIASVADSVETNMTQEEMAKFISRQLAEGTGWNIESTAASGTGDMQPCFSSGSQLLWVMQPDMGSVEAIKQKMGQILQMQ